MGGKTSSASKAKYNAKAYDRMELVVKKGKRDELKNYAEARGESLNGMIKRLLEQETGLEL